MQQKEMLLLLSVLRELQTINQEFPIQYAICLTEISLSEGISLTTLSEKVSMPLSTTSRIVGALSQKRQKGKPYDLVTIHISPTERRKKRLYLSPRGQYLLQNIGNLLTEPCEKRSTTQKDDCIA